MLWEGTCRELSCLCTSTYSLNFISDFGNGTRITGFQLIHVQWFSCSFVNRLEWKKKKNELKILWKSSVLCLPFISETVACLGEKISHKSDFKSLITFFFKHIDSKWSTRSRNWTCLWDCIFIWTMNGKESVFSQIKLKLWGQFETTNKQYYSCTKSVCQCIYLVFFLLPWHSWFKMLRH